jgi:hypothetical protein
LNLQAEIGQGVKGIRCSYERTVTAGEPV